MTPAQRPFSAYKRHVHIGVAIITADLFGIAVAWVAGAPLWAFTGWIGCGVIVTVAALRTIITGHTMYPETTAADWLPWWARRCTCQHRHVLPQHSGQCPRWHPWYLW